MDKAVKAYLAMVPDERKPIVDALHMLIVGLYPKATIDMKYKMPTYQMGDGWVALANQKNYVSLYTCGYHHIAAFKEKHPKIKTGKGCINFRPTDQLPVQNLKAVIKHAITQAKVK